MALEFGTIRIDRKSYHFQKISETGRRAWLLTSWNEHHIIEVNRLPSGKLFARRGRHPKNLFKRNTFQLPRFRMRQGYGVRASFSQKFDTLHDLGTVYDHSE